MRYRKYFILIILVFLVFPMWFTSYSGIGLAAPDKSRTPPVQPDYVYGLVRVNGAFVPEGTLISAWCNNEVMVAEESTILYQGEAWYSMDVPPDDPDTTGKDGCISGDEINFKINYKINEEYQILDAEETKQWVAEGYSTLDLSANFDTVENKVFLPIILR